MRGEDEMIKSGLVECASCGKAVPDAIVCVYCGNPLRSIPIPKLSPTEQRVLSFLAKVIGSSSIDDIYVGVGGGKGSIRNVLQILVKFGLIMRPKRGHYALTDAGKRVIEKESEVVVAKPKEWAKISVFAPQYINRTVARRLFKNAGYARAGTRSIDTLIEILEELGDEIATKAVELMKVSGRKTVVLRDMEQAIREITGTKEEGQ